MKKLIFSLMIISAQGLFAQENEDKFQERVRALSPQPSLLVESPIQRLEALQRAEEVLNLRFYYSAENAENKNNVGACRFKNGDLWLKPTRLDGKEESVVTRVPYKWGGYFPELSYFKKQVARGTTVGDICTCRDEKYDYCIVRSSVGLDCSGFLSYSWKSQYYTTSSLHKISSEITWEELQPGDALNKAGSHTMLFRKFIGDGKKRVNVIESAVRCNGVCTSDYRVSDLIAQGFKPIRYNNIVD